jgi:putative Mg2+ transporter-C (MgtC) family protein
VAAVGVLLGVGFYVSALVLALLSALSMSLLRHLETCLPSRSTLDVQLSLRVGHAPQLDDLAAAAAARGHQVVRESLVINVDHARPVWRFAVVATDRARAASPSMLAEALTSAEGIESFSITPVRL